MPWRFDRSMGDGALVTRSCGPRRTPEPTGTGSRRAPGPATKGLRVRGATAVARGNTGLRGIGAGSGIPCGRPEIRCGQGGENAHGTSRRLEGSPRGALPSRVDGIRQARRSSCGPWPGPAGRPNPARSSQVALSAVQRADDCRRGGRKAVAQDCCAGYSACFCAARSGFYSRSRRPLTIQKRPFFILLLDFPTGFATFLSEARMPRKGSAGRDSRAALSF